MLTGSSDKSIRMWDIHKGACVRLFTGHARGVVALAISPNGRHLASGDLAGVVKIWDIAEGKLLKSLSCETATSKTKSVYSLSFCQDGKVLSACSADNTCRVWDALKPSQAGVNEEPIASFLTKQTPIVTSRFSPRNVLTVAGAFSSE